MSQPSATIIGAGIVGMATASYLQRDGHAVTPLEGASLRRAFAGQPLARKEPIYWEHEGNAAIRVGDLKLVRAGRNGAWELYDLKKDRTEQQDLGAAQPDKVKELAAQWEAWALRANVKPYPTAGGKKGK